MNRGDAVGFGVTIGQRAAIVAIVTSLFVAGWLMVGALTASADSLASCGATGALTRSVNGATFTCTYDMTGEDAFSVPAGVTSVDVVAVGGSGGAGGRWVITVVNDGAGYPPNGGGGGDGALVSGTLEVTPDEVLRVEVGGDGGTGAQPSGRGPGGWNGGGDSGFNDAMGGGDSGGGGGGASDVQTVPCGTECPGDADSLASRLLVAAGGGGGGGGGVSTLNMAAPPDSIGGTGGAGGANGAPGGLPQDAPDLGGGGGTNLTGGAAAPLCGVDPGGDFDMLATSGVLGSGGMGGWSAGGGGGGGYYGGGGGGGQSNGCFSSVGGGGGAGGGSSYGPPGSLFAQDTTGVPLVSISWTIGLPRESISTPTNGENFTQGQAVATSFGCEEGSGGSGITSCLDQNGDGSGSAVDTSSPGTHFFTVTGTSADGLTSTATVTYTVGSASPTAPAAPITSGPTTPAAPVISAPTTPAASITPVLATQTPTTPAPSLFAPSVGNVRLSGTSVQVRLGCAGSGSCQLTMALDVSETFKDGKLAAVAAKAKTTRRTVIVGTTTVTLEAGQSRTATVELNVAGQRLLRSHHPLRVMFVARGGTTVLSSQNLTFRQPHE